MKRRAFFNLIGPGAALLALAACGSPVTNPLQQPVNVDLTTLKRYVNVGYLACVFAAAALGSAVPAGVSDALADFQAVNTKLQGLVTTDTTVASLATQALADLQSLSGLLNLTAGVKSGIVIVVSVVTAFIQDVAIIVPALPAEITNNAAMAQQRGLDRLTWKRRHADLDFHVVGGFGALLPA